MAKFCVIFSAIILSSFAQPRIQSSGSGRQNYGSILTPSIPTTPPPILYNRIDSSDTLDADPIKNNDSTRLHSLLLRLSSRVNLEIFDVEQEILDFIRTEIEQGMLRGCGNSSHPIPPRIIEEAVDVTAFPYTQMRGTSDSTCKKLPHTPITRFVALDSFVTPYTNMRGIQCSQVFNIMSSSLSNVCPYGNDGRQRYIENCFPSYSIQILNN